jgi:hypothetical protein
MGGEATSEGGDGRQVVQDIGTTPVIQTADPLAGTTIPPRQISGVSAGLRRRLEEQAAVEKGIYFPKAQVTGPGGMVEERAVYSPIQAKAMNLGAPAAGQVYTGNYLVNARGEIERARYDIYDSSNDVEVMTQLNALKSDERYRVLKELERVGFYGNSEVSDIVRNQTGTYTDTDLNAFRLFLDVSNRQGVTWDVALTTLGGMPTIKTGGPTVRVSSEQDITAYMKEASLRTLGRMPTKAEIAQAIKNIQNAERAAVRGGQQAPGLGTAATAEAGKRGAEAGAYAAGTAIARMYQLLGGK